MESKLITKRLPWHANFTELNHLGRAAIIKPEVFENVLTQIFTSMDYYSDNPLTSTLFNMKNIKKINSREWEWGLRGKTTKPLVVTDQIETGTAIGRYKSEFRIVLDENWYLPGDVITPGSTNKRFQSRVQTNPVRYGNGWLYTLRLVSDDPQAVIPEKYLKPGVKWGKLFSIYEEGAEESGSTQFSAPIMLRNRMSRLRKKYEVTGDVATEVLATKVVDSNGKPHTSWIKYVEVEYWKQWYRELERSVWYSRKSDSIHGSTGRPVITGPGVQEQLEDSHIHYYTHLTARLIEEYLMDIFYARIKPGSQRRIKAYTGEYGMILFHRAMQQLVDASGWTIVGSNFNPIQKTSSEYNSNAYAVGYQFVKYIMGNGIELELVHNPLYDDLDINFEIDPVTGKPVESMRITFLDFSNNDKGESNIKIMKKNDSFKLGYVAGLTSPYGPAKNSLMSHSGDYYEMHVQDEIGVHIEDVTRCGELKLARN